eukprot:TRINITY_DN14193_c0_g1_i1.p1 TRINITY_DN14193_c0_g1~~TRINITY_DN14193_c0_g1_i1.p1  ORF type:complete len:238 (+),score=28.72 TRINITY_DN14193_c0_g1_i1:101-715(+)
MVSAVGGVRWWIGALLVIASAAYCNADCIAAPLPSHVCDIPSSGNIIYQIDEAKNDVCTNWNKPSRKNQSKGNTTVSDTTCQVSEACINLVSRYFCSFYCARCEVVDGTKTLLPPCQDLCDNYTKCHEEYDCLPMPPDMPTTCANGIFSWSPQSASSCTALTMITDNFLGKRSSDDDDNHTDSAATTLSAPPTALLLSSLLRWF